MRLNRWMRRLLMALLALVLMGVLLAASLI